MKLALKWFVPIALTAMGLAWVSEQVALLLGFEPPPQDLVKLFTDPNVAWQVKAKYAAFAVILAPVLEEIIFRMMLLRFCVWSGKVIKKENAYFDKDIYRKFKWLFFFVMALSLSTVVLDAFYVGIGCLSIAVWFVASVCMKLSACKSWNKVSAIPVVPMLLSGAVFAAVHLHAATFLPLWFLGVAFAWLYWKSGSLFSSMLCHFLFNLVNLIMCLVFGSKMA
jgi:membrane protease YdiL (CAAX protease family)